MLSGSGGGARMRSGGADVRTQVHKHKAITGNGDEPGFFGAQTFFFFLNSFFFFLFFGGGGGRRAFEKAPYLSSASAVEQ